MLGLIKLYNLFWKLNTRIPWKTKLFIIYSNNLTNFLKKKKAHKLLSFYCFLIYWGIIQTPTAKISRLKKHCSCSEYIAFEKGNQLSWIISAQSSFCTVSLKCFHHCWCVQTNFSAARTNIHQHLKSAVPMQGVLIGMFM